MKPTAAFFKATFVRRSCSSAIHEETAREEIIKMSARVVIVKTGSHAAYNAPSAKGAANVRIWHDECDGDQGSYAP